MAGVAKYSLRRDDFVELSMSTQGDAQYGFIDMQQLQWRRHLAAEKSTFVYISQFETT